MSPQASISAPAEVGDQREESTAGVSATEHGRAKATIEQLQARIEELEEEAAGADLRGLLRRVLDEVENLHPALRTAIEQALRG